MTELTQKETTIGYQTEELAKKKQKVLGKSEELKVLEKELGEMKQSLQV